MLPLIVRPSRAKLTALGRHRVSGFPWMLVRGYLEVFAFFAPDREHVRREHSLIESSLRETYEEYRAQGGAAGSALASIRDHLAELWPHALIAKTRADCASALPDPRYALRVRSGVGGLAAIAVTAFLALGLGSAPPQAPGEVALVFPAGHPRAGQVQLVAKTGSIHESVYVATRGRVCIDHDLSGAEITDEVMNRTSTAKEREACAHYRLP